MPDDPESANHVEERAIAHFNLSIEIYNATRPPAQSSWSSSTRFALKRAVIEF
jgi:hypothetical protein